MKFDTTRNKLLNAYKLQEDNRKKTTRKPTTVESNENLPVTIKENVIYDTGWIKTVDGGTLIDNGLKVTQIDGKNEIVADPLTVETFVELSHSNVSAFAVKNSTGYNSVEIEFNKAFDIPEEQLPFVDYAVIVKPISDSKIEYKIQYTGKVYDPKSLIKITGDGSLICYAYLSSSTLPRYWDKGYYDNGYLSASKTSKWYYGTVEFHDVLSGDDYVLTGYLDSVNVEWDFAEVTHLTPPPATFWNYKTFEGGGISSIIGTVVTAKGKYESIKQVGGIPQVDTSKTVQINNPSANVDVRMYGTYTVNGGSPISMPALGGLFRINDSDSDWVPGRNRVLDSFSFDFIDKYKVFYTNAQIRPVKLRVGWELTDLPNIFTYDPQSMPYTQFRLELNPGDNPLPIDTFYTGYPYDTNINLIRLTHEKDSLDRYKYQLNGIKSFMYTAKATEDDDSNRQTVNETYSHDGSVYLKNSDNRPFKTLTQYETSLAELEFKIVVFLTPQPKYNRENKHK